MPDPQFGAVSFSEAINFLRKKTNIPTKRWFDVMREGHNIGFMVAGATQADLLTDFHQSINHAIKNGTTLNDFRKNFDTIVEKHGWSYKGSRGWRSRTIFETNMHTAYAAGKWGQYQQNKQNQPYLRYVPIKDSRTRKLHLKWRNIILPVDHPFWKTHYPPNGWGCRCTAKAVSERQMKRRGWKVSDSPRIKKVLVVDPKTKKKRLVPEGIDQGFDYAPGSTVANQKKIVAKKTKAWPPALENKYEKLLNTHLKTSK